MAELVQGGPGEMITAKEAARRRLAASPEAMAAYETRSIQGVGERISPLENERRRRAASPEAMAAYDRSNFPAPGSASTKTVLGMPYGPGGAPDGSGRGQAQQGVRPGTQAAKTRAIDTAVGNFFRGLSTPSVGGAGAMMSLEVTLLQCLQKQSL